ncbi:MAG: TetR/AcrR family transcriptional regulator [Lachnospiraceae bacterium]|nr:TetR/AcrR family transcriptional regulator [Lachnospiraceae bacterium]
MPPKAKFTREEIIGAALGIVRQQGIEALTARILANELGSSPRPIFTVFTGMEEVQEEVRNAAMKVFEGYAGEASEYTPVFKQIGIQMIQFAIREPKLFQLLYMQEHTDSKSFEEYLKYLGDTAEVCLTVIEREYGLTRGEAIALFRQVWIFTFGICVLCATGACRFTEMEIQEMLSREFASMLMLIKSGRLDSCAVLPERQAEK